MENGACQLRSWLCVCAIAIFLPAPQPGNLVVALGETLKRIRVPQPCQAEVTAVTSQEHGHKITARDDLVELTIIRE